MQMYHLFIHAHPKNGGQGIILLHRERDSEWSTDEIKAFRALFPTHFRKKNVIHANDQVSPNMVAEYQLRREKGLSQRYSIAHTFEAMEQYQRDRIFRSLYPLLAELIDFEREAHLYPEIDPHPTPRVFPGIVKNQDDEN